ncbi:MAG TPA: MBL fold metallo-hydrolase [Gemmatimonadales bacterium]|nr:MBL fold metallo-hydrolase [Gemmatimonadales bacterium]
MPAPGPETVRYGGNTSCLEVRGSEGTMVVLDAGTGIRALGRSLEREAGNDRLHVELFITHAHWDHVQGLPFFAPLYMAGARVSISSPERLTTSVEQVLDTMMSPTVFPVTRAALRARLAFPRVGDHPVEAGAARVHSMPALHPDGAVGFRVESTSNRNEAIVYFPDNEIRMSHGKLNPSEWRRRFMEFANGASVLVHDAMYTEAEYEHRAGWGHSTVGDAVELAAEASVPRLVLFHHAPDRTDEEMDAILEGAQEMAVRLGATLEVDAAREGE